MNAIPAAPDPILVTVRTFVRAESDTYMAQLLQRTGGVNRWHHDRQPAAVDAQTVIRQNRDTLYSFAIADLRAGATLTLPQTSGRYQTAMIVNQDHFINRVFDQPGSYALTVAEFDTPYVLVAVRTLVDPTDAADIRAVNAVQDQLTLEAPSTTPFTPPAYDQASLNATRAALLELSRGVTDFHDAFGSQQQTDPIIHLIGTASGWGGLPAAQAFYLNVEPRLPVGHYPLTVGEVPVRAFWSISVYNQAGYFEPNALGRYTVNSVTAARNADGTVTVNFGGDASLPNQIPIMEGWNYAVRLYQPEPAILDGTWTFPALDATA